MTTTRHPRPGIRKKTLTEEIQVGSWSIMAILIVLTAGVSLAYLLYANQVATKGYVLKNLQAERTRLLIQQEKLDMKIAQATTLESLRNNPRVANMVKYQGNLVFVRGDTAFAVLDR